MTAREYLGQAYRIDERIKVLTSEIAQLREMAVTISSPGYDVSYNPNKPQEAPFEKTLAEIDRKEKLLDSACRKLLETREEVSQVIEAVGDTDSPGHINERLVLHYRYIDNLTWDRIGEKMNADAHTIRRWHDKALTHIRLPEKE